MTRWTAAIILILLTTRLPAQGSNVELQLRVESPSGQPMPCRVHFYDKEEKARRASGLPYWKDHFVCSGTVTLPLPPGRYRYEIERGPEWQRIAGSVEVTDRPKQTLIIQMRRLADLAGQGWYSGDLHIHRPVRDMELLMRAEDLHIGPVITWWNATNLWAGRERPRALLHQFDGNRFYNVMAGEDERGGGALLYFHLNEPLPIAKATREHPSSLRFLDAARRLKSDVWIDIEKPFWWDLPLWLASGRCDSIGIANNHMQRRQMMANEAWGRARDERSFPGPLGNGHWTQAIYYHILNCGIRLPPSAGSASGVLANPVGYNRVYVHVAGDLTYDRWWAGLRAGRCFVTNGPLLLCTANGQLPGHVFREHGDKEIAIDLDLTLLGADAVHQLEIIANGVVAKTIAVDSAVQQQNRRTKIALRESGWFLVRAIANNPETFRFASTAPFYVEVGQSTRRISQPSVRFFQEWLVEREQRLRAQQLPAQHWSDLSNDLKQSGQFWDALSARATAAAPPSSHRDQPEQ